MSQNSERPRVVLILLVALVFLLGLFAGWRIFYHQSEEPPGASRATQSAPSLSETTGEAADSSALFLVNLQEERVSKLVLSNQTARLTFVAQTEEGEEAKSAAETQYSLKEPDWSIIDPAAVQTLVQSLLTVRFKKLAKENVADFAPFGLDKPLATVSYTLGDGEEIQLLIGAALPEEKQSYARLQGEDKVYIVANVAARAQSSVLNLIRPTLTTVNNQHIKALRLTRASDGSDFSFQVLPAPDAPQTAAGQGAPESEAGGGPSEGEGKKPSAEGEAGKAGEEQPRGPLSLARRKWELVAPLRWDARSSDINGMVSEFAELSPREYVAYGNLDWSLYGLDKPSYTVLLQSDYEEATLQIGDRTEGGKRYARLLDHPLVFTLNMSAFSLIDRPLQDFISPYLASLNINTVAALEVQGEGLSFRAELYVPTRAEEESHPERKEFFTVNGQNADIINSGHEHYFKQVYRSLIALQIDGLDLDAPADYAADFSIMYTLKEHLNDLPRKAENEEGDWRIRLDFAARDASTYFVYLNGKSTGFYINQSQLDLNRNGQPGIKQTWERLAEAMRMQVDGVYDMPVE